MTLSANAASRRHGFSLVEVTLALGIMAFCIIPAFGLLPVGINANQASLNQTRAASVIANICSDVRGTPLALSTSPRFGIKVNDGETKTLFFSASGDTVSDNATADMQYRAVVKVIPATAPAATAVSVVVSWPAAAVNSNSKYQSTTAINRN